MLYDEILREREKLQQYQDEIHMQLKNLPQGSFICSHNGNRTKWYESDGKTKKYIPKKERHLAEQLAFKKYLSLTSDYLANEIRALDYYLKQHSKNPNKALRLLTEDSDFQDLLHPFFTAPSKQLSAWQTASYEKNMKFPEQLIHKTSSGHLVRSKSESFIALYLHSHQIPFRYECALQLGETLLHPDFTICHPRTLQIYYWEHFGRMDDPTYARNVFSKLQLYANYKIIPSINLITTYETKEHPLNTTMIENIIEQYFL